MLGFGWPKMRVLDLLWRYIYCMMGICYFVNKIIYVIYTYTSFEMGFELPNYCNFCSLDNLIPCIGRWDWKLWIGARINSLLLFFLLLSCWVGLKTMKHIPINAEIVDVTSKISWWFLLMSKWSSDLSALPNVTKSFGG